MSNLYRWYQRNRVKIAPYLFITPNLILFFVFMIIPVLFIIFISFHQWSIIGTPSFVGLENYTNIIRDPLFWNSLGKTVYFTLGAVPISIVLGLAGAVLLNTKVPLRGFFRSIFFAPVVVSLVATGLIWSWMLNSDFGLVNHILEIIGIGKINWLSSTTWAMPSLIMTFVWVQTGYCLVIFLSGLQNIPESLYEAADIDGAGKFGQFIHVTLPLLRPTTIFVLIISVINSLMAFDLIYTMTNGGPGNSTTILINYIYETAFDQGAMGYGSAVGVIQFIIIMIFSLIMLYSGREKN